MTDHLRHRITRPGPKRILALDGGGIRGVITIEVLAEIEAILAKKSNTGDAFRLSDYFDFVAGTSTGAILATCISLGMKVEDIRKFYHESGAEMFDKASILKRYHRYKYKDEKLAEKIRNVIGYEANGTPSTFGSEKLKTVLMLVMRNVTTDSPWPLSNNPFAKYNQRDRKDRNLDLPLWQLVRASTAAPVYFPPESITLGNKTFVFVDGGITPYNNPAFQAFLMATLEPYKMGWKTGEKDLMVVSVGTGECPEVDLELEGDDLNTLHNAKTIPSALMYGCLNEQDILCRSMGRCLHGHEIDRELGTLMTTKGPCEPRLFSYVRYNAELTRTGLDKLGLTDIDPEKVGKLDAYQNIGDLQRIGKAIAPSVKEKHLI